MARLDALLGGLDGLRRNRRSEPGSGGEVTGHGEAELSARLMRELPRGRAVTVRHRVHRTPRPTDTQMTANEVASMGRSSSG